MIRFGEELKYSFVYAERVSEVFHTLGSASITTTEHRRFNFVLESNQLANGTLAVRIKFLPFSERLKKSQWEPTGL